MQKWIILVVIILIVIIGIVIVTNVDIETEYIPESEIEEVELRKTIVSLYFIDKQTNQISKETRLIDSKELLKNPYEKLVNMLVEGPQGENLQKILPDNISILETNYENGCVTVNFNSEFENVENKNIIFEAIEKTLKELTEVVKVQFLIDGNEIESNSSIVENDVLENVNTSNTISNNTSTNSINENNTVAENTVISE